MYKITSFSELRTFTAQVADALDMHIDEDKIAEVFGKINLITMLLGPASRAVALAERFQNKKMLDLMSDPKLAEFGPYSKKLVFNGLARTEIYYATLTRKQYTSMLLALDSLRLLAFKLDY